MHIAWILYSFVFIAGFGTTNTNTNLFGSQQNPGTNLFGTSTTTPAFGQANKPAGFSFGATSGTNLFGQPQQTAQQTTPFGQTASTANTNLFGTTPGMRSNFKYISVPCKSGRCSLIHSGCFNFQRVRHNKYSNNKYDWHCR